MFCKICNKTCQSLKNHIIKEHLDLYQNNNIDEINKLYYDTYIDATEHKCPICGNESKFVYKYFPGKYRECCSSLSCVRKYQFNHAKEKWELNHPGHSYSEHLYEKNVRGQATIKKNLQKKYGNHITNVSQLQSTKDKVRNTCLEKYGYTTYTQTDEYKQQIKHSAIEKYGIDSVNKVPEKIEKYKLTCIKKYGSDNYFGSKENWKYITNIIEEKYGVDNVIKLKETQDKILKTKRKNGTFNSSILEEICYNILCNFYGTTNILQQYTDNRYIDPINGHKFACDFYIINLDLFIEIQGIHSHGEHPYYINEDLNIHSIDKINSDTRITLKEFAYRDILKRSVAKYTKINYIEIFFKNKNDYNEISINFILNNYIKNMVNVFIEPYVPKINDSIIYYYDITNHETIKQLLT